MTTSAETNPQANYNTQAYFMILCEQAGNEPILDWVMQNLILNAFERGQSQFWLMQDGSAIILTEQPDNEVNAAVFNRPAAIRWALDNNDPCLAGVDPEMLSTLRHTCDEVTKFQSLMELALSEEQGHA